MQQQQFKIQILAQTLVSYLAPLEENRGKIALVTKSSLASSGIISSLGWEMTCLIDLQK